jgi:hypothetical protein
VTKEGLERMKSRLNPGGRLVINSVTQAPDGSPGLQRLESGLKDVFGEAMVYMDQAHGGVEDLVNVCLVAGTGLKAGDGKGYPGKATPYVQRQVAGIVGRGRPAVKTLEPNTDDFSDLDHAEAELRLQWRKIILGQLGPEVLGD